MAQKSASASRRKTSAKRPAKKPTAKARVTVAKGSVATAVPNVLRLTTNVGKLLWEHKVLFGLLTLLYGILTIVLAQSFQATDATGLKHSFDALFKGQFGSLASNLTVFVVIIGSNSSNTANGWVQVTIAVIMSLAIIWALRHVMAGERVTLKASLYQGMAPLIPFLIVLFIIGLQLLPLIIGSALYGAAMNGVAVHTWEKLSWIAVYLLLGLWSGYMLSSSIFGVYIVTLPDMTPLAALRSARQLVKKRRWLVLRKVLFLPLVIMLAYAVVMLPIIAIAVAVAPYAFFILTCFTVVFLHAYMYGLYRELINAQG